MGDDYLVYGTRKLWKAARRAGLDIDRGQVARLMRASGIEGARRTERVRRTTRADPVAARQPDLVRRRFCGDGPNQLWVTDLTYVPTWARVAYVCFILDAYSRMIVGRRVAAYMRTSMVLDALEMVPWSRGLGCPICGVIPMRHRSSRRCATESGRLRPVRNPGAGRSGTPTLTETVNGHHEAELIRGPARSGLWKTVEEVELATPGWVHWHNHQRLHSDLRDQSPSEYEQASRAAHRDDQHPVEIP